MTKFEKREHKFCRYADDNNVYVKSIGVGMEHRLKKLKQIMRGWVNQPNKNIPKYTLNSNEPPYTE